MLAARIALAAAALAATSDAAAAVAAAAAAAASAAAAAASASAAAAAAAAAALVVSTTAVSATAAARTRIAACWVMILPALTSTISLTSLTSLISISCIASTSSSAARLRRAAAATAACSASQDRRAAVPGRILRPDDAGFGRGMLGGASTSARDHGDSSDARDRSESTSDDGFARGIGGGVSSSDAGAEGFDTGDDVGGGGDMGNRALWRPGSGSCEAELGEKGVESHVEPSQCHVWRRCCSCC